MFYIQEMNPTYLTAPIVKSLRLQWEDSDHAVLPDGAPVQAHSERINLIRCTNSRTRIFIGGQFKDGAFHILHWGDLSPLFFSSGLGSPLP